MRTPLLTIALLLAGMTLFAQSARPDAAYLAHAQRAFGYYEAKEYARSGRAYDSLLRGRKAPVRAKDYYDAACSWTLAGDLDKAWRYLDQAVAAGWANLDHIGKDADLATLHADARWQPLLDRVAKNKEQQEAKLNKPLVALLDTIYHEDQDGRRQLMTLMKERGNTGPHIDSAWRVLSVLDSVNQRRVTAILDKYGWLGPDEVGQQGATTLFLVIQHADSATMEKYLPLFRAAVKRGAAAPQQLALMEDRVLMNRGEPQIYGSQVKNDPVSGKPSFHTIRDEKNVNKRRAEVGLGPLEEYARNFGFEYTLPKN